MNAKVFDCKINVGVDAGLTVKEGPDTLSKTVADKLNEMECVDVCWSKATPAV